EPDIGIGCDLPRNRGFGVVCPGETEQGARSGGLRDHFALNEKTGHRQRCCYRHEGFRRLFWQCQLLGPPDPAGRGGRHWLVKTFELCLHGTAYVHQRLYPGIRTGANEDLAANGMGFDTIGGVDRAPYSAVFGTFDRAYVADNDFTSINTNAHGEFGHLELAL